MNWVETGSMKCNWLISEKLSRLSAQYCNVWCLKTEAINTKPNLKEILDITNYSRIHFILLKL